MLHDEPAGRFGDQVGRVALLAAGSLVDVPVALALAGQVKVIDRAVVMAVKMREALIVWMPLCVIVAKVPFTESAALLVTSLGQSLRQRDLTRVESEMPPRRNHRTRHAEPNRIATGHQPGPRWAAHREHVKVIQLGTFTGNPVEMRC